MIDRRTFVKATALGAVGSLVLPALGPARGSELLYNGIRLPRRWPPRQPLLTREPAATPFYLLDPPPAIPIDLGRQLFVDDFLIEESTLYRSHHAADYFPGNPILRPTAIWERYDEGAERSREPQRPTAMPFSDGVWFDPADRLFKMWYMAGYGHHTCLAVSDDGIDWRKPACDVIPGTNIVLDEDRDSNTVWLDHQERNPRLRYKMTVFVRSGMRLRRYVSSDGIHWQPAGFGGPALDRSTFFYNPFRRVWVSSLRDDDSHKEVGRFRRYFESREFLGLRTWTEAEAVPWVSADVLDPPRPGVRAKPELYNLDCVAYESVLLGLFTIFNGDPNGRHKPNHVCVGFSRDGFHWARPFRQPFINVSEQYGDWNWTNVQSAGGCCLIVGDRLHFYVSGRAGVRDSDSPGVCTTGLATLRRDGFVSLDDFGDAPPRRDPRSVLPTRSVTTRPVVFNGSRLFVNAHILAGGELRAEVLDVGGNVVESFSAARCEPIRENGTRIRVRWAGGATLAELAGQWVRFRFYLESGRLYAFWVSRAEQGASSGYVAAGGPTFNGPVDTDDL